MIKPVAVGKLFECVCVLDEWEQQDSSDPERLTGLEDFGVLLRPLGLSEKKQIPEPIPFTEPDPLGALSAAHAHAQGRGNTRTRWTHLHWRLSRAYSEVASHRKKINQSVTGLLFSCNSTSWDVVFLSYHCSLLTVRIFFKYVLEMRPVRNHKA